MTDENEKEPAVAEDASATVAGNAAETGVEEAAENRAAADAADREAPAPDGPPIDAEAPAEAEAANLVEGTRDATSADVTSAESTSAAAMDTEAASTADEASGDAPVPSEDPSPAEGATAVETQEAAPSPESASASPESASASPESASAPPAKFVLEPWVIGVLESLVFASPDPLTPARALEILAAEATASDAATTPKLQDVKKAFQVLKERWLVPPVAGFRLVEVDGALCLRTAAEHARYVRRLQMQKPAKLSRAALETLAVIAYRQPVTKPQIEEVRGVDSAGAVKALLDKKLVRVIGKAEDVGRPLLYGTTKQFLELFHLASLNDLPTLKELHELDAGAATEPAEPQETPRAAIVMDLFNPEQVGLVSEETEKESQEALQALERALGEAKDVAKKASTLVRGMDVDEDAPSALPVPDDGEKEPA